jgi:hypothetical protein
LVSASATKPKARAKPHRRRPRRKVERPAPQRAPSSFFTSLHAALPVPGHADTARGIDARSLKLAAGALLLVVAVGGSFLLLVSQTPRTR